MRVALKCREDTDMSMQNPESRWHREKDEYRNLFTFGKMGRVPERRRRGIPTA